MLTVQDLAKYTKELSKRITFNTENLYLHTCMFRGNDGNRKVSFQIINNNAISYTDTLAEFINYMRNTHSTDDSNATGNLKNLLQCAGYYKNASNVWYEPKFIYYSTNANTVRILGVKAQDATIAPNSLTILGDFGTTFTIIDNVTTIALNNVLRPSMIEYNTKLSLGGTQESNANIHWVCLKTPMPNGKFLYKWMGHYLQTKSVAITTAYGSNFMSAKFAMEVPDSKIINKAIIFARQSGSTTWIAGSYGGSSLDFYMLRATSATINNTLEINVQAEYIDN